MPASNLDTLLNQFTPQDVIGAIFAYSGLETFPSDRQKLHKFIRDKKVEGKELLEPFVFSEGVDLFPFSRLLESVFMQLQLAGCLSAKNPEYERFGLTDAIRERIKEKTEQRFNRTQLQLLEKIGQDFGREFAID